MVRNNVKIWNLMLFFIHNITKRLENYHRLYEVLYMDSLLDQIVFNAQIIQIVQ